MSVQTETEAEKMRRVPGIVFADGPAGRRARLAGTGLDIFEIIGPYKDMGEDWQNLKEWFDWLTDEQLQTALAYYAAYPAEIDERLEREESRTPERVWATYPFMKPPWR